MLAADRVAARPRPALFSSPVSATRSSATWAGVVKTKNAASSPFLPREVGEGNHVNGSARSTAEVAFDEVPQLAPHAAQSRLRIGVTATAMSARKVLAASIACRWIH